MRKYQVLKVQKVSSAKSSESVLKPEKVWESIRKYEKVSLKFGKCAKSSESMRKCTKSWESRRNCATTWESMGKCAKSWESIRKCAKTCVNVPLAIFALLMLFFWQYKFFWCGEKKNSACSTNVCREPATFWWEFCHVLPSYVKFLKRSTKVCCIF